MENNEKTDIIRSSMSGPIKELFTDIADLSLNHVIEIMTKESELLKDIPFIKWLFTANDFRNVFQTAFFLQKYANFIGPINKSIKDDPSNDRKLEEIFSDKKKLSKIVDQTIISLDRYQTTQKAKMLGILFVETFKKKNFTVKEYDTLIFSIENIHPTIGIEYLKSFYDYKCEMDKEENEELKRKIWSKNSRIDYSSLANTGLLILPSGAVVCDNLGGAYINELGYRFYTLVASKI